MPRGSNGGKVTGTRRQEGKVREIGGRGKGKWLSERRVRQEAKEGINKRIEVFGKL